MYVYPNNYTFLINAIYLDSDFRQTLPIKNMIFASFKYKYLEKNTCVASRKSSNSLQHTFFLFKTINSSLS